VIDNIIEIRDRLRGAPPTDRAIDMLRASVGDHAQKKPLALSRHAKKRRALARTYFKTVLVFWTNPFGLDAPAPLCRARANVSARHSVL